MLGELGGEVGVVLEVECVARGEERRRGVESGEWWLWWWWFGGRELGGRGGGGFERFNGVVVVVVTVGRSGNRGVAKDDQLSHCWPSVGIVCLCICVSGGFIWVLVLEVDWV